MTSLFSLLITMAMLLSGASASEDPTALASRTTTISDIVVTLNGEEYAIDPTASFTAQTENNEALFDFYATANGETLMPAQAKISEDSVSIRFRDSMVYTFPADYIDQQLSDIGAQDIFTSLTDMEAITSPIDLEAAQAYSEKLLASAKVQEATLTIKGENYPADYYQITIDKDQVAELVDAVYTKEFMDVYLGYLKFLTEMSGGYTGNMTSFEDFYIASGFEMSADLGLTISKDQKASYASIKMYLKDGVNTSAITGFISSEAGQYTTMYLEFPKEIGAAGYMKFNTTIDGSSTLTTVEMNLSNDDSAITCQATVTEDAETQTADISYNINLAEEGSLSFTSSMTGDKLGNSAAHYDFGFSSSDLNAGARFTVTSLAGAHVVDRIAGENAVEPDEDNSHWTGLGLSAMGMLTDFEKIATDPSVMALIDAIEAFTLPTQIETDSFVMTYVPKDYRLVETTTYNNTRTSLTLQYAGNSYMYYPNLYIDITENAETTYYEYDANGELVPVQNQDLVIFTTEGADMVYAQAIKDGRTIEIYSYSNAFTLKELQMIWEGIQFDAYSSNPTDAVSPYSQKPDLDKPPIEIPDITVPRRDAQVA